MILSYAWSLGSCPVKDLCGPFWYNSCFRAKLNGKYLRNGVNSITGCFLVGMEKHLLNEASGNENQTELMS